MSTRFSALIIHHFLPPRRTRKHHSLPSFRFCLFDTLQEIQQLWIVFIVELVILEVVNGFCMPFICVY